MVLAVWGWLTAAATGIPPPTGALPGDLAAAFDTGLVEAAVWRTGARGAAVMFVGIRWVAVLVVLVVLGCTAIVVGVGTVACVTCGNDCAARGGAVDTALSALVASEAWVWGEAPMFTASMATTAVAVTRGAATTLVARWCTRPRLSCRMACRGADSRIRLNTAAPCERVSHVQHVHQRSPLPHWSPCLVRAEKPLTGLGFGHADRQLPWPLRP